jgi:hypothetical protein
MSANKPIVHYLPMEGWPIVVGQCANVIPLDHTSYSVSNNRWATTSIVISENDNGFETENSIYVKENENV